MRVGQIYKIKSGSENKCGNFIACGGEKIKIIPKNTIGLYYEVLDKNNQKINDCCDCFKEEDLIPEIKDFNTLEIGDLIDCGNGDKRLVLSVLPSDPNNAVYVLSLADDKKATESFLTAQEIKNKGWKIIQPEPVEEVKEMTVADVEKLVGSKVKIIKE